MSARRTSLSLVAALLVACGTSSPGGAPDPGAASGGGSGSSSGSSGSSGASGSSSGGSSSGSSGSSNGASSGASDAGSSSGAPSDAGSDAPPVSTGTTIRVHYPAGAHAVAIRGSLAPLDWNAGQAMTSGASDTWTFTIAAPLSAPLDFKPLLDDATWSRGPNYTVQPGATVDVYPHFTTVAGSYSRAFDFPSTVLGNTRGIWIYKPPSYDENTRASFPVVYMHDGQNLFDASTAFGGNEWKIDETMNAAAEDGTIAEALVIGIENTADRMSEYTPVADATQTPPGGNGADYLKMIVTELKPKIDGMLRTIPDRHHTFMMGSSLGGLISAYAGVENADTFGGVGVMSPSTWWDNDWIVGEIGNVAKKGAHANRVYVDSGDSGPSNDDVTNTAQLAQAYRGVGYADGATLDYLVQQGGQHNEVYWSQRAPGALAFLLGARSP